MRSPGPLVLLLLVASAAAEPPVIRIRARTRLVMEGVERTADGAVVSGTLVDEALGTGVAGRPVRILLRGALDTVEALDATDGRGRFETPVRAPLGRYEVQIDFPGDGDYAPPPPETRTVDVARRPLALALSGPERASRAAGPVPLRIDARDRGAPADVAVALLVGDRPVAMLATGRTGQVATAVDLPDGAAPGTRVVARARFAGDAVRDAAQAEHAILVAAPSRIEATVEGAVERGASFVVAGTLADPDGPLAGQPVSVLTDDGRALGHALTDGSGRFRARCSSRGLAVGAARLEATFAPTVSWRDPARAPVAVTVLPARPIPLAGWLAPPLGTAALLGLGWLVRRRPWLRLRRRRARPADADFPGARSATASGLVAAKPRLRAALRRADDHGLDGVVWDAAFDRPVAAQVSAVAVGGGRTATCGPDGRFALEELPAGRCAFTVVAPGYLAERFERDLPHRGELRGVRINLQPVRAEIFALWRQSAAPWLPPEAPDTRTPREVVARAAALACLAALVEETYWSPRVADEGQLAEAVRLASEADRG